VLSRIIAHPEFRAGRLSTQFLERILPELTPAGGRYEAIAIIAAVLAEHERLRGPATAVAEGVPPSAWRTGWHPGWRAGSR
jgi:hypothetical protein